MCQCDAQTVADGNRCRVADGDRAVRVPADSIAPAEHGQRAQRIQPRGDPSQAAISTVPCVRTRASELAVSFHESCADPAEASTKIKRLQRQPKRLVGTFARRHVCTETLSQLVGELAGVTAAHRDAALHARIARPCQHGLQARLMAAQTCVEAPVCAMCQPIDVRSDVVPLGDHEFRGCGGRRRAEVGDKIGDGDVGLVPDGRNRRYRTRGDRSRHGLLIEGPQIFDRSSAASDDDDINARHLTDRRQCSRDVRGGTGALDAGRAEHDVRVWGSGA